MTWLFHICPDHAAKHLGQNQAYPPHVSPTSVPVPVTASYHNQKVPYSCNIAPPGGHQVFKHII